MMYMTPKSWPKKATYNFLSTISRFKAFRLFFMEAVFRLHPSLHKILNPLTRSLRSDFGCSTIVLLLLLLVLLLLLLLLLLLPLYVPVILLLLLRVVARAVKHRHTFWPSGADMFNPGQAQR